MKRFFYFLILGLLLFALGIYIWVSPNSFMNIVTILLGIYLIFDGFKTLYLLFRVKKSIKDVGVEIKSDLTTGVKVTMIVKAALNIIVGIIGIIIVASSKDAAIRIMMIIIGVDFIVSGVIDLIEYFSLKAKGFDSGSVIVEGILALILGVLFCIFPEVLGDTALRILSVVIMIVGVVNVCHAIYSLILQSKLKKYGISQSKGKKNSTDAEFEEINSSDDIDQEK